MTSVRTGRQRKAMALLLVLGLVALTLGLSYSLLRTHSVDDELARNQTRKNDARAAAQAGMSVALRKLYDDTWNGADTSFTAALDPSGLTGFVATYTTGDASLTASSADWAEYPFRLTIDCKGYSIDPTTATGRSEYTIRVVTQLLRRKLNTSLVTAPGLEAFSIYQTSSSHARIHYPIRLTGDVFLQGELEFSRQYPQNYLDTKYMTYYSHLRDMYLFNPSWDYRPFTGTLYTPSSRQPNSGDVLKVLDAKLVVPRVDVPISSVSPVPVVTSFSGYRLYAKGKSYAPRVLPLQANAGQIPNAQYVLTAGNYSPDPQSNPLGIFTCTQGSIGVTSNTALQGLMLAYGSAGSADVHIAGQNVTLQGMILPDVQGSNTSYRLPSVMAQDDVRVYDGSSRTVDGWIVAGDEFQLEAGASSSAITATGGVFCSKLYLDERSSWIQNNGQWISTYNAWSGALGKTGLNVYFPGWLATFQSAWGVYLTPRLIFNPTPNGVKNHLPDFSQPIYIADPTDGGLLWDIVRWQEIGA